MVAGRKLGMEFIGHGVDLLEIARVEQLLRRNDDFLYGWFTSRELEELGSRSSRAEVVGGRVAAKEATVKALGSGFNDAVSWQDVEILSNDSGAPVVTLSGGALEVAGRLGVTQMLVTVSHTSTIAIASVIALGCRPMPSPSK